MLHQSLLVSIMLHKNSHIFIHTFWCQFVLFAWTDWARYDLSTQIPTHPVMARALHTKISKHILCTGEHSYNMVHYNTVLHTTWLGLQFTVAILIASSTYKLWPNIWCGIHTKWWGICRLSLKVHHHNNNWWQKAASNFFHLHIAMHELICSWNMVMHNSIRTTPKIVWVIHWLYNSKSDKYCCWYWDNCK